MCGVRCPVQEIEQSKSTSTTNLLVRNRCTLVGMSMHMHPNPPFCNTVLQSNPAPVVDPDDEEGLRLPDAQLHRVGRSCMCVCM